MRMFRIMALAFTLLLALSGVNPVLAQDQQPQPADRKSVV